MMCSHLTGCGCVSLWDLTEHKSTVSVRKSGSLELIQVLK